MPDDTPRPDVLTRARELHANGVSLNGIARILQAERYPTERGGTWYAQQAKNLLNSPRPRSAFLVPCAECGRLTASKYGTCTKPSCRSAHQRRSLESRKPKAPRWPCESCGQPTKSRLGVCGRLSCRNERMRLERAAQKGAPSVYAVWFPSPRILKIGLSGNTTNSIFVGSARIRAKRRDWDTSGSRFLWKQPGDLRTEAWMQVNLAFRWQSAFKLRSGRLSEWFHVPDAAERDIVEVLEHVYALVPAGSS